MKPTIDGPGWSEQEEKYLRENVGNLSCGDMARGLGQMGFARTRSAVVGKLHRMGINIGKDAPKIARLRPVSVRETRRESKRITSTLIAKAKTVESPPAPPKVVFKGWPKPMTQTAILFLNLPRVGRCRMPLWGDDEPLESRFCCGASTEGTSSYCRDCKALTIGEDSRRAA